MMNCITTYSNSSTVSSAFKANYEAFQKRLRYLYPCVDDVSKLPQAWSRDAKAPSLGLTYDNLGCYFKGDFRSESDGDKYEASAVRTDNYIPPSCLLYYFEIKFISKGRDGLICIGLASEAAVLEKFPGCARESYGYKADDGTKFSYDVKSHPYGPTFTTGDVIGCGYNLIEGKCFFTKNGSPLGEAFDNIPSNILLYPSIGLKTSGEEIRANFGQEEFEYDIDQDLRTLKKKMTLDIANYPIPDFSGWQSTVHKLVQSWLLENNYLNTANAFTKEARLDNNTSFQQDAQQRSQFQQLILSGRITEAIKLLDLLFPNLLQGNPRLLFVLKCRQFVEMISGADDGDLNSTTNNAKHPSKVNEEKFARLLESGRELLEFHEQDVSSKMLHDTLGLIAYENPKNSHLGKTLDPIGREYVSQLLNSMILKKERGEYYKQPLENVMDHLRKLIEINDFQCNWLLDGLF